MKENVTLTLGVTLIIIHLLCVTINVESISKTSIKHLCDWNNWNGTERNKKNYTP